LNETSPGPRPRTTRNILIILLVVIFVTIGAGYFFWRMTRQAVESVFSRVITKKEETIDLGALVTQVRELNRLETATMHVMHVSTTTQTYDMVPDTLTGDQLTLLAVGDVIAGVDMSLLNKSDAWRQPDGTCLHRRSLGRLALPGAAPGRLRQPAEVAQCGGCRDRANSRRLGHRHRAGGQALRSRLPATVAGTLRFSAG